MLSKSVLCGMIYIESMIYYYMYIMEWAIFTLSLMQNYEFTY